MESKYREVINPKTLFQAEGFSHAVGTTGTKVFYLSGQLPWDENFQVVGEGDFEKQTEKSFENIEHVLDDIGARWDHVVKLVIYTTKPEKSETIAKIKHRFLNGVPSPAKTTIGIAGLADPRCFIEIEATVVM